MAGSDGTYATYVSSGITTSKPIEQINFWVPIFVSLFLFTALSAGYVWTIRGLKSKPDAAFWIQRFEDAFKWTSLALCGAFFFIVLISAIIWDKVFAPLTMLHCFFLGSTFLGLYFFTLNQINPLNDDDLSKMSIYLSVGAVVALIAMGGSLVRTKSSSSSSASSSSSSTSSSALSALAALKKHTHTSLSSSHPPPASRLSSLLPSTRSKHVTFAG